MNYPATIIINGHSQDFGSGEHFLGSASWEIGGGAPGAGELSKIFKIFLNKIAKSALF